MIRRAACLLLAAAALPATAALAQDQTTPPPAADVTVPTVTLPDPIVVPSTQPPVTQTTPTATRTAPPAAETRTTPQRRVAARTERTRASTTPTRTRAPARQAAPAAVTAAPAPAAPAAPAAGPAPVAQVPATTTAPLPVPQEPAANAGGLPIWTWLIGGALVALLGFALLNMLRHRRRDEDVVETYEEPGFAGGPVRETYAYEPELVAAPIAAAPLMSADDLDADAEVEDASVAEVAQAEERPLVDSPSRTRETLSTPMGDVVSPEEFEAVGEPVAVAEDVAVAEPDPADVEALAASSAAPGGRPWLEFLMRPIRAGTSKDAAIVEFELTVGNTGSADARDVRIATFMFPAGSSSEMERMLIEPPADSAVEQGTIAAGEATRVEGQIALPRESIGGESVLPVVVADARYMLPDGSEGRTRASFEVGIPSGEGLDPFPTDRVSGLLESVEARLHGEPERV